MALITAPDFLKTSMESAQFRLRRIDFVMRSGFTMQRQVMAWHSGHMWEASCSVPNLEGENAGLMRAMLVGARGRVNTVHFPVPGYRGPSNGYSGPAGLVKGAGQTGYSLDTDGWAVSQTVLPTGSYVTFNGELKVLTAPLETNASGEGTLYFEPAIRYAPADNSPIIYTDPYAIMSMSDAAGAGWSLSAPRFHGFDLAFEEAVNVT